MNPSVYVSEILDVVARRFPEMAAPEVSAVLREDDLGIMSLIVEDEVVFKGQGYVKMRDLYRVADDLVEVVYFVGHPSLGSDNWLVGQVKEIVYA